MENKQIAILETSRLLEGKKVLYFEGAGWDFHEEENFANSDVGNFRIRTSFLNNNGEQIYIEMGNTVQYDKKGKNVERYGLWVDFCFKVPSNGEEIQYHEIYKRHIEHLENRKLDYSKEAITKWINERLNCDFDTIHVLDRMYGYNTHGDIVDGVTTYNLMENVELDHEKVIKRITAYDSAMEYYKDTHKFPCVSVLERLDNGIKVKCSASEKELNGLERVKVFTA